MPSDGSFVIALLIDRLFPGMHWSPLQATRDYKRMAGV